MPRKTWTLTDVVGDVYTEQISLGPDDVGGAARGYSVETLPDITRRGCVVLVHHGYLDPRDLPTEGVAEHEELHKREDHRAHHQRRTAEEFPHVALDDCGDALQFHAFGSTAP